MIFSHIVPHGPDLTSLLWKISILFKSLITCILHRQLNTIRDQTEDTNDQNDNGITLQFITILVSGNEDKTVNKI